MVSHFISMTIHFQHSTSLHTQPYLLTNIKNGKRLDNYLSHDYFLYKRSLNLFIESEGPLLETLDCVFNISAVHQSFYILICNVVLLHSCDLNTLPRKTFSCRSSHEAKIPCILCIFLKVYIY